MHIEPGVVEGTKILLSYATATAAAGLVFKTTGLALRQQGVLAIVLRSFLAALMIFACFEILPHQPVGVSEVHLILGSTIYLLFGVFPAAVGLAAGLAVQSLFFAPMDLPQYGMNVTTLLMPLLAMHVLAGRIIPSKTAYVDLEYAQVLKLSATYQAGIVAWVAFWAVYGHGFSVDNVQNVLSFAGAYMLVVLLEPVIDLAVLAVAKSMHTLRASKLVHDRLYTAQSV